MRNRVSILKGARNIVVKHGSLVVNADTSKGNLERLFDEVAPNAILNAGGRADEVRCYPGTREEVIGKIERWMDGHGELCHRMMWLSGPAGAGKSAIAQTITERCQKRGVHAASFFFFRGDLTRNLARPLVATLVYQLRRFYPALDQLLTDCLTVDPLICSASIEQQFMRLISSPVQVLRDASPTPGPIVLIIDGLDECDSERRQEQILKSLHSLVEEDGSPFRVLVASRAKPHLVMSFNKIASSAESIFLDEKYTPRDDIRRFVITKFDEIKKLHHLALTLGEDWPAEADINAITDKSSGQFIYAATVMRYIQYSTGSPALSLLAINTMRPSDSHTPLAQLDAVYSYIFSKAGDIQTVKLILYIHFITGEVEYSGTSEALLRLAGYTAVEIQSFFAGLAAVVQVTTQPHTRLVFYHASLSDYLKGKSRSGVYFVSTGEFAANLSAICLRSFHDKDSLNIAIQVLGYATEASIELTESLLDASTRRFNEDFGSVSCWGPLIRAIERLYFKADKALFKIMLQSWIRFAYINHINIRGSYFFMNTHAASIYYKWYRATKGAVFALRLQR